LVRFVEKAGRKKKRQAIIKPLNEEGVGGQKCTCSIRALKKLAHVRKRAMSMEPVGKDFPSKRGGEEHVYA